MPAAPSIDHAAPSDAAEPSDVVDESPSVIALYGARARYFRTQQTTNQ
jgi:hypothetical protein